MYQALAGNLITLCLNELEESDPVLRQWLAICLGRIWDRHEDGRNTFITHKPYMQKVSNKSRWCCIRIKCKKTDYAAKRLVTGDNDHACVRPTMLIVANNFCSTRDLDSSILVRPFPFHWWIRFNCISAWVNRIVYISYILRRRHV